MNCVLKNWDKFDPQSLKKTFLTVFCKPAWPWYPLESSRQWLVEGSLSYDTVLQLDPVLWSQRKWVEVPYVLLFFSLQDMPDFCPEVIRSVLQGTDSGIKPSAPSCPLPLPLYSGLTTEQAEVKEAPPGRLPQSQGSSNNPSSNAASDFFGFNRNSDKVKEAQTTKTKDETEDEKRMGMRKSRFP